MPAQNKAGLYRNKAVIRLQHLGNWIALSMVGSALISLRMRVQNLSSPFFPARIGVVECKIANRKELCDSNVLERRSEQNHIMLLEIIGSDVPARFDCGLHSICPKSPVNIATPWSSPVPVYPFS